MTWQPIETAPKEGQEIIALGYNRDDYSYGIHVAVVRFRGGEWRDDENEIYSYLRLWTEVPSGIQS